MSINRRYDTVAFDVRQDATMLFFASTTATGDIDDYLLLMRAQGDGRTTSYSLTRRGTTTLTRWLRATPVEFPVLNHPVALRLLLAGPARGLARVEALASGGPERPAAEPPPAGPQEGAGGDADSGDQRAGGWRAPRSKPTARSSGRPSASTSSLGPRAEPPMPAMRTADGPMSTPRRPAR